MRLFEIVKLAEDGGTTSGSIATVAMPMGTVIRRNSDNLLIGAKYNSDSTPNTPESYKQYKRKKNAK